MAARALSLNLTAGMRLVGTRARGCPALLTAHRSVSNLIIIKPSRLREEARGPELALPLTHQEEQELTGLCTSLAGMTLFNCFSPFCLFWFFAFIEHFVVQNVGIYLLYCFFKKIVSTQYSVYIAIL